MRCASRSVTVPARAEQASSLTLEQTPAQGRDCFSQV